MDQLVPAILAALIALLPLAGIGLARPRPRRLAALADPVLQAALAAVALVALIGLALPGRTLHLASLPLAGVEHAVAGGIRADRLGLVMAAFIAGIGLVVHRYARRQLRDDPRGGAFLATLAVVVAAALAQALSPGLVQFAAGWVLASVGLQRMIRHDRSRPAAALAASAKFLVSRLGDAAMAVAIAALLIGPGTTDFAALALVTDPASVSWLPVAGVAVVVAVACKSALAPFQGWLIGTVQAPTPLSALMHAGVVNAGGFLVLRLTPLFAHAPAALHLLLLVGLASALIGPLAMWAQTDLKRSLAWSTVGQMGFMAVQCGMGAYGAAFLHLIGHGCYKADAFLRSGTLARAEEPRPRPVGAGVACAHWLLGVAVAGGILAATYRALGDGGLHLHGGLALLAVQALAMGQLVATPTVGGGGLLLRLALLVPASALYAAFSWGAEAFLAGVVVPSPSLGERGGPGPALAVLVPLAFAAQGAFWVLLPGCCAHPRVVALRVHAANGFYLPQLTERVVLAFRPRPVPPTAIAIAEPS